MRFTSLTLTCLCLVMLAVPAAAEDKKSGRHVDPQVMMETYKKLQ
jgi:hypothetical protein